MIDKMRVSTYDTNMVLDAAHIGNRALYSVFFQRGLTPLW